MPGVRAVDSDAHAEAGMTPPLVRQKPGYYTGSTYRAGVRFELLVDRGVSGWWHWVAWGIGASWRVERSGRALSLRSARADMARALDSIPRIVRPT